MQTGQLSKQYRNYLRPFSHLNAEVMNRDGELIKTTITDLTLSGLTLEGDTMLKKHIEATDPKTGEPFFPVEASVIFSVELDNTPCRLKATCRLVRKHRLSQHSFNLGMKILAIDEGGRNQLARYIEHSGKT